MSNIYSYAYILFHTTMLISERFFFCSAQRTLQIEKNLMEMTMQVFTIQLSYRGRIDSIHM